MLRRGDVCLIVITGRQSNRRRGRGHLRKVLADGLSGDVVRRNRIAVDLARHGGRSRNIARRINDVAIVVDEHRSGSCGDARSNKNSDVGAPRSSAICRDRDRIKSASALRVVVLNGQEAGGRARTDNTSDVALGAALFEEGLHRVV